MLRALSQLNAAKAGRSTIVIPITRRQSMGLISIAIITSKSIIALYRQAGVRSFIEGRLTAVDSGCLGLLPILRLVVVCLGIFIGAFLWVPIVTIIVFGVYIWVP